jgi:hypothetical protein
MLGGDGLEKEPSRNFVSAAPRTTNTIPQKIYATTLKAPNDVWIEEIDFSWSR